MFADQIYYPLVNALRHRPDEPAVCVNEMNCDNRHFAMLVAPVMNELDTFPDETVALLMEQEPLTYAAAIACMLCGKTIVPIPVDWPDERRKEVMTAADVRHVLSKESMFYYSWMAYEDAICRIDSGFLPERDLPHAARVFDWDEQQKLTEKTLSAEEFFDYFCAPYFKNIVKSH